VQSVYNRRLLILEDDPSVGNIIRTIAISSGLEARVLLHSEGLFHALNEWQPTHIVLDLVMPEMDGVQVLVELAARQCSAKIIIISGMGNRVLNAAGREANEHGLHVIGVLAKPFSAAALRTLLREVLDASPNDGDARQHDKSAEPFDLTEAELRHGIENQELWIAYQPKIECAAGGLAGFEALVRWAHPRHGLIMPDQFVSFAENHGLIGALTDSVLEQALDWFSAHFLNDGPAAEARGLRSGISLSINLSGTSLKDVTLVDRMTAFCQQRRIPSGRLILKLTETSAMKNSITSLDMLTRMRMKGFQLSIDDFGTGYSSMLELVPMPISEIKVDKSFVISATRSAESRAVVKSIVDLGRSLGLKSAAEGVENAETLELLKQLGCNFAQGYWIGRPMEGNAIPGWMSSKWG
jgi:EAL domain-containing protein (putative c-di-GMP-specific phosphodiesterase class I)/FixJ family two-component response regulator